MPQLIFTGGGEGGGELTKMPLSGFNTPNISHIVQTLSERMSFLELLNATEEFYWLIMVLCVNLLSL